MTEILNFTDGINKKGAVLHPKTKHRSLLLIQPFPFPSPSPYAKIPLSHHPKEALTHDPTNIRQLDRI